MNEINPQLKVINSLDAPIIVQAGAGSGKTYTLTERIVNFIKKGGDIEQIVAITFTKKAAEELKSRIRSRLEEENMHSQALKVDGAYITTIHGFANKILKENALAFSIDPNFQIIDEVKENSINDESIKQAIFYITSGQKFLNELEEHSEILTSQDQTNQTVIDSDFDLSGFKPIDVQQDDDFLEILANQIQEFVGDLVSANATKMLTQNVISTLTNDEIGSIDSIIENVSKIISKIELIPFFEEKKFQLGKRVDYQELFKKYDQLIHDFLNRVEFSSSVREQEIKVSFFCLLDDIDEIMQEQSFGDNNINYKDELAYLISSTPILSPKFHEKQSDRDSVLAFKCDFAKLAIEFMCTAGFDILNFLGELSFLANDFSSIIKSNLNLSNNDILRVCLEKLSENPKIAKSYQEKFSLIMIDEFQDTDQLQLGLIGAIAKPKMQNVCTVGDVQQSIYRFRGADVKTSITYKNLMLSTNNELLIVDLPNNYRSHSDILSFCDLIFEQNEMFANNFLHLEPKGSINELEDKTFENNPRVKVDITNYSSRSKNKISTEEVVCKQAKACATHIKELIDAGENPGKIAILLGKLVSGKNNPHSSPLQIAKIYADALREEGVDSIISSGSTFSMSKEVDFIKNLLSYARNCLDSSSLLNILRSPYFSISDDALLALTHSIKEDNLDSRIKVVDHCDLAKTFLSPNEEMLAFLNEDDLKNYKFAASALTNFISDVANLPMSTSIRNFLNYCGVFDKLDDSKPEGLVSGGNFVKCLHLIDALQDQCLGIASIQEEFTSRLNFSKESPGILSEIDSKYVQIMTIHASKGLQFDHVVCAELKDGLLSTQDKKQRLFTQNILSKDYGLSTCASYLAKFDCINFNKLISNNPYFYDQRTEILENMTCGEVFTSLYLNEKNESFNEAKRLLYVAITRAIKSVLVMHRINSQVGNEEENWEDPDKLGIFAYLFKVLKWDFNSSYSCEKIKLPNGSNAQITFTHLPEALNENVDDDTCKSEESESSVINNEIDDFRVRNNRNNIEIERSNKNEKERDFYSYTSLSALDKDDAGFLSINSKNTPSTNDDLASQTNEEDYAYDEDRTTDFGDRMHLKMQMIVQNKSSKIDLDNEDKRMIDAINNIINTKCFVDLIKLENVIPEVDFCVPINVSNSNTKFLRGACDLVGYNDFENINVVDYKSGKRPKDHSLQAKTYAYALLNSGFKKVKIDFLHAEIKDKTKGDQCALQSFSFDDGDVEDIETELVNLCSLDDTK